MHIFYLKKVTNKQIISVEKKLRDMRARSPKRIFETDALYLFLISIGELSGFSLGNIPYLN